MKGLRTQERIPEMRGMVGCSMVKITGPKMPSGETPVGKRHLHSFRVSHSLG